MPATGPHQPAAAGASTPHKQRTDVTLFWNARTGALTVSVHDHGTGTNFQFAAEPDQALHAFYHPYAHAAAQDLLTILRAA